MSEPVQLDVDALKHPPRTRTTVTPWFFSVSEGAQPLAAVYGSLVEPWQPLEYEQYQLECALQLYHQAVGEERSA